MFVLKEKLDENMLNENKFNDEKRILNDKKEENTNLHSGIIFLFLFIFS
jgi:hypothetical protein